MPATKTLRAFWSSFDVRGLARSRPEPPRLDPPAPPPSGKLIDLLTREALAAPQTPAARAAAPQAPPAAQDLAPLLAVIDFDAHGNADGYKLTGWSHQEPGFVWATGSSSELLWPEPSACTDLTLDIDLFPCLLPPYRTVQRLFIRSERGLLGRVDVTESARVTVPLRDEDVAGGIEKLIFYHPDAAVPSEAADIPDGRDLSLAFRRIGIHGRRVRPRPAVINKLPVPAPTAQEALSDKDLMLCFEGLGGTAQGCEFGLLQRQCGAEPIGLLRWTLMNAENLADALEQQFDGVGTPEQTILDYFTWPTHLEYRTEDRRFFMGMHTWVKKDDKPYDAMFKSSCHRLRFLKRKLLDDLAAAEKIFVFKMGDHTCTLPQITRIHRAVRGYGPNTLLYVRTADTAHPPGSVVRIEDGLLIGHVTHFNTHPDGNVRPMAVNDWMAVCRAAHAIWRAGPR